MALEVGRHKVEILENSLSTVNGKPVVRLLIQTQQEDFAEVLIWMTEKSMGIARASLKICGFDCDAEDLAVLDSDPTRLRGKMIEIFAEDRQGTIRAQIALNQKPDAGTIASLTKQLRAANRSGEVEEDPLG